jgi:hypothetical protein
MFRFKFSSICGIMSWMSVMVTEDARWQAARDRATAPVPAPSCSRSKGRSRMEVGKQLGNTQTLKNIIDASHQRSQVLKPGKYSNIEL